MLKQGRDRSHVNDCNQAPLGSIFPKQGFGVYLGPFLFMERKIVYYSEYWHTSKLINSQPFTKLGPSSVFYQQRHLGLQQTQKHVALEGNGWGSFSEGPGEQNTCYLMQYKENIFLYISSQSSSMHSGLFSSSPQTWLLLCIWIPSFLFGPVINQSLFMWEPFPFVCSCFPWISAYPCTLGLVEMPALALGSSKAEVC